MHKILANTADGLHELAEQDRIREEGESSVERFAERRTYGREETVGMILRFLAGYKHLSMFDTLRVPTERTLADVVAEFTPPLYHWSMTDLIPAMQAESIRARELAAAYQAEHEKWEREIESARRMDADRARAIRESLAARTA